MSGTDWKTEDLIWSEALVQHLTDWDLTDAI
jgi:hypothetical protein